MNTATLEKPDINVVMGGVSFSAAIEPAGVKEKMLALGVSFADVSLVEKLIPAINFALSCKKSCNVNPLNVLHKIRTAFYDLSQAGEITRDESTRLVARMMSASGDNFQSGRKVVRAFGNGDFSALQL